MKKIEYIAEVLPDLHLSLPEDIIQLLNLTAHSKLRVQIQPEHGLKRDLSYFCGKWQGNDAQDIVQDIYNSRKRNNRSDNFEL
ncbi:MAG: hypothetical protein H6696_18565 [Deferribacteres bacterium]|nr:hypothetical protein [Deferribacteres bacterium]